MCRPESKAEQIRALVCKIDSSLTADSLLAEARELLVWARTCDDEIQSLWDMLEEKDASDRDAHTAIVKGVKLVKQAKRDPIVA